MTLNLYDGSNGLFDKLCQWFGVLRMLVDDRTTVLGRIDTAQGTYTDPEKYMTAPMTEAYRGLKNAGSDPAVQASLATCNSTLINFIDEEIPLASRSVPDALRVLYDQMVLQGVTVESGSVGASAAAIGSPIGDGLMLFPTLGQNVYEQVITAKCVMDALTGTLEGQEIFTVSTPQAVRAPFATDWARGTGLTIQATPLYYLGGPATGPSQQGLRNGAWGTFDDDDLPESWEIISGGSGISSVSGAVQGTLAMLWTGDGSIAPEIRQNLDGVAGAGLLPNTSYIFGFWIKASATAPSGGSTTLTIVGDGGTPLATATIADAALTTDYQLVTASFTTTALLPLAPYARLFRTGAIQNTRTLTFSCGFNSEPISFGASRDKATLAQFLIYSGPEPFRNGDTIEGTITNNRGGEVQMWCDRVFNTAANGIVLPSSGTPTVPDSAIPS